MNYHHRADHKTNYSTSAAVMPVFEQATLKASIRQRRFEEVGADLGSLKPGSIIWARSLRLNRHGENVIDGQKCRPYFFWDFQKTDDAHVPVLHAFKISASASKQNGSKYHLDRHEASSFWNNARDSVIDFHVLNLLPLTTQFFSKDPRDFDSSNNLIIIRNPGHDFSSDQWEAFVNCRMDALMWNPSLQCGGPKDEDLSGILAGVQLPVDYSIREEISRASQFNYSMPPAPDFRAGPKDTFIHRYTLSGPHNFSEGDITNIALNAFDKYAPRYIPTLEDRNRLRALIRGDNVDTASPPDP